MDKKEKLVGFVTMEIVMATVIFAACLGAALSLLWYERALAQSSQLRQEAQLIAKSEMEKAKVSLKNDFYFNPSLEFYQNVFTIKISQKFITSYVKELAVLVSWPGTTSLLEKYELKYPVYNISEMAEADTCNLVLSGDWQHPQVLPGGINLGSEIIPTGIDVKNNLAYISADSNTQSKADFFIISLADLNNPVILSSLSTGPGLAAVKVFGNYAYVANLSTVTQLQIINISNPLNPFLVYSFSTGSGSKGVSLYYSKQKIYLGTEISAYKEFYIIDVSNALNPITLGSFETNTKVNSVQIFNNLAYLATPNEQQVRVLNIADPANIAVLGSFTSSGYLVQSGKSLYLNGNKLFFGKNGLNNVANHKLFYLDVENSANDPVKIDSQNIGSTPNALFERSGYVFVATNDVSKEFQVWQVSGSGVMSNLANIDLPQEAVGEDCEGNAMFIIANSQDALKIITPGS
jgi:hypothetical protein